MKIAIFTRAYITHPNCYGGIPSTCKTLAEGLMKYGGNEVHVITTGLKCETVSVTGVRIHHVDCPPLLYTPQWYEQAHKKYVELGNDFDIAYSESGANSQFVEQLNAVKIARLHGISYEEVINHLNLIYVQGRMPNEQDFKLIQDKYIQYFKDIEILKRYDALVAISNVSAEVMRHRFFHKNVITIYNAYDEEIFKPNPDIQYNPLLFVSAGKPDPRKGFDTIQKAMEIARSTIPELQLIIAQGLSQEKLAELYQSACAFIDASNHYTGMNMSCIEAMGCELPVICSDIENFREITDGWQPLFPVGNIEELANRIIRINREKGLRHITSKEALESAKKFCLKDNISKHLELFKKGAL